MKKVSVYFVSQYGQSEKIAHRICRDFEMSGWTPTLYPIARLPKDHRISSANQIVVCAPLHKESYGNRVKNLLSRNRDVLSSTTTSFVSVSMSAHGNAKQKQEARAAAIGLFKNVRWEPTYFLNAAGAVNYLNYNPLIRYAMRRICEKSGGPTDTNRNYEYTDWNEVDCFTRDLTEMSLPSCFSHEIQFPEQVHLNQLMPNFDITTEHEIFIPRDRRLAFEALSSLLPADMPFASILARIRTLGAKGQPSIGFKQASEKFGLILLYEEMDRESIGGLVGRFWQFNFGIQRFENQSDFLRFNEKNHTKIVSSFYFKDVRGGCMVKSQTRIQSTDDLGRRHFQKYWFFLSPAIKLYMKDVLNGVRRKCLKRDQHKTLQSPALT